MEKEGIPITITNKWEEADLMVSEREDEKLICRYLWKVLKVFDNTEVGWEVCFATGCGWIYELILDFLDSLQFLLNQ